MPSGIKRVVDYIKGLNKGVALSAIGVIAIAIIIFVLTNVFKPSEYSQLYENLDTSDSIEIQRHLSSKNIEFKTNAEGNEVMVKGNPSSVRADLALAGLPSNPEVSGLEKFSEISLGGTKYDKEIQYQHRLQEELESSIVSSFEGVERANVKLPKASEKSIFDDEVEDKSISVAIKFKAGVEITEENVNAIQLFVASSIEDIKAENVEVVDSKMNVLSGNVEGKGSTKGSNSADITDATREKLENDLKMSLEDIYGDVKVIVNLDINFDEIVQNIETIDPEGTILSTESLRDREMSVQGTPGGVPGTDANGDVPNYEIENIDENDATYLKDKEQLVENFSIGKTVEKIIKQPELRNTNVAVWIDSELTEEQLQDLEEMIAVSSGLTGQVNRNQGDKSTYENGSVKVVQTNFATGDVDVFEDDEEKGLVDEGISMVVWIVIGALSIFSLVLLILLLSKRSKRKVGALEENVFEEESVKVEVPEKDEKEKVEEAAPTELEKELDFKWTEEGESLRKVTNEVSKKYPKETADVIKKMLSED